ncbi:hypothetical protein [Alistipes megaguti]|uniref:hypothetical protein n=1 Tax=Alistipes megaguti TaxID=2364787 RepID=UPI000EFA8E0C|nr:hypothetical protein [Alistipes megaguti]
MKQTMLTLFTPLLALLLCGTACSSDDSNAGTPNPTPTPPAPQPTSYDIYTAGYKRVDSKAAATVWKNGSVLYTYSVTPASSQARTLLLAGSDLYAAGNLLTGGTQQVGQIWLNGDAYETLTDGTTPGDVRGLFLAGGTLYAAGSKGEEAVVWKNGTQLYTLSDGTSSGSMPYAVAAWGDDLFTAGTLFGSSRHAAVWKGSDLLYTLGRGEAYAMYVVPHYESDETTGAEDSGDTSGNN